MNLHPSTFQPSTSTQVIIIGAGPAGLAVAACLRRQDIPFLILEQSDQVGASWRNHYDRLHLHTDKARSALPHLPFPADYPRYPSRDQVVDYLEQYARHFDLNPCFNQEVIHASRITHHASRFTHHAWQVRTRDALYHSQVLVVATGYTRRPVIPSWPGQSAFQGPILHSSRYRNGASFDGQRVLVVGFGNSGGEIAIDLWEHGAQAALAVRSPVNVIPRDLFGLPLLAITIPLSILPSRLADFLTAPILRWKFGRLSALGLRQSTIGPFTQTEKQARIPLIDVGTMALLKEGQVQLYPGLDSYNEESVVFEDGSERPFDAVILATGYRPAVHDFLEAGIPAIDETGTPQVSGAETPLPGLYFCGFIVSVRGVLYEIAQEAQQIARLISKQ